MNSGSRISVIRSKRHHLNMGNFEWMEISAEITSVADAENADEVFADLGKALDEALAADIAEANDLSAEKQTYAQLLVRTSTDGKK